MKQHYVLGFMFNNDLSKVALIRKTKPAWQFGSLNGIGGKVEPGEVPIEAMAREFKEETGADTLAATWSKLGQLNFPNAIVGLFTNKLADLSTLRTTTEEVVTVVEVSRFASGYFVEDFVPNVPYLVALAIEHERGGQKTHVTIDTR